MGHVNGLLVVGRRRREQHEQVVALPCRGLRGGFRGQVEEIDVVDDDVRVMLLSPLLAEGPVKPGVVRGNEVAPLKNFQRFLFRRRAFREQKKWTGTHAGYKSAAPRPFDEVST